MTTTEAVIVKAPRVEAIMAGAAAAFSEKGFAATTMRQIAQASESSLGGIYHHFDSKESILRAIMAGNFRRVLASLDERLAGVADPQEAFEIFVENHVAFFARHLDEMRVMAHELDTLTGEAGREVAELRRAYTERARDILHALRPERADEELNVDVLCLFGMLIWTYRWFHSLEGTVDVRELAAQMADLYLRGFSGAGAAGAA
jgi:TetR/AcrR family transcriptional regulator